MSIVIVPCISIKPRSITIYSKVEGLKAKKAKRWASLLHDGTAYKASKAKGLMSSNAINRLTNAILLLSDCSKPRSIFNPATKKYYTFRTNFVTLTLQSEQVHSDREIHTKIFKEFIRAWKRKNPDLLYVWKAETQANGNLHYHLITNSYIGWKELRNMWNYYSEKLGYITRCRVNDPNSTDIKAVKSEQALGRYLSKYFSKTEPNRRVPSIRRWDCSQALTLKTPTIEGIGETIYNEIEQLEKMGCPSVRHEFAFVIYPFKSEMYRLKTIGEVYKNYIKSVKEYNRDKPD